MMMLKSNILQQIGWGQVRLQLLKGANDTHGVV
jgi:hypothetical protein